jgi:hypothetical protein
VERVLIYVLFAAFLMLANRSTTKSSAIEKRKWKMLRARI